MKKAVFFILISMLGFFDSVACLNYFYSVDIEGHLHEDDEFRTGFNINFNARLIEKRLIKLEKQLRESNDYRLLSDYAVLLLKAGKTKESLELLISLYNQYPNEYQIAANLGTAFEINGELEKALRFIKKGLELNPDSHNGSEWVHVKILEAKMAMETDKNYLKSHSILQLTEADKKDTLNRNQILIQVRERFPFSPPPNLIMANILTDLADCYAYTASIEYAKALYTLAVTHYNASEKLLDSRIEEMAELREKYADIRPEKRKTIGDNVKVKGIRYQTLLDNNNLDNYKIRENKIMFNTDSLLSLTGIKKNVFIENEEMEKPKDTITTPSVLIQNTDIPQSESNWIWYGVLGLLVGFITIYLLKRLKS